MYQNWGKLLFMHWRIEPKLLRPLIPPQLEIDTFDGSAWIGVVPFTMWGIRASFLPAGRAGIATGGRGIGPQPLQAKDRQGYQDPDAA